VRIGHGAGARAALGHPLVRTGRALGQFPLVAEQVLKVVVVPLGGVVVQAPSRPLVIVSGPLPLPKLFFQPRPCSSMGAPSGSGPTCAAGPRRGICRRCVRRQSARPSPRRSSPCGRRSRGCRGGARADRGCRWGLPGSRRSGPSARRPGDSRVRGRRCSACRPATCFPGPSRCPLRVPRRPRGHPPKPKVLKPMDSRATLPARIIRSAQEILRPYFCLMGQSRRRALSRLALSGQLLSGAKRCVPVCRRRRGRRRCGRCPRCARPCG
jgi:hypothetical protein